WFLFEEDIKNYQKQIKHYRLMNNLQENIDLKRRYRLKVYPSGTISLRKI
ncbi:MAG: hypothetical protein H8D22_06045, partial [Candidatus Cloacimonetes bacterium]|nr:hypothetical protein [Candidatus Cloacimonadota bacterium]